MSAALFFGGAAILAIVVVLGKKLKGVIAERRFAQLPGRDPATPLCIGSYSEIEATVDRSRCACAGPMIKIGEGPATVAGGPLLSPSQPTVRVLAECRYCGRQAALYFDVSGIPQ